MTNIGINTEYLQFVGGGPWLVLATTPGLVTNGQFFPNTISNSYFKNHLGWEAQFSGWHRFVRDPSDPVLINGDLTTVSVAAGVNGEAPLASFYLGDTPWQIETRLGPQLRGLWHEYAYYPGGFIQSGKDLLAGGSADLEVGNKRFAVYGNVDVLAVVADSSRVVDSLDPNHVIEENPFADGLAIIFGGGATVNF